MEVAILIFTIIAAIAAVATLWFVILDWNGRKVLVELQFERRVPVTTIRDSIPFQDRHLTVANQVVNRAATQPDFPYLVVKVTKRRGPPMQRIRVYLEMKRNGRIETCDFPHGGPTVLSMNDTHYCPRTRSTSQMPR
jgi:hypothetical protein